MCEANKQDIKPVFATTKILPFTFTALFTPRFYATRLGRFHGVLLHGERNKHVTWYIHAEHDGLHLGLVLGFELEHEETRATLKLTIGFEGVLYPIFRRLLWRTTVIS